MATLQPQFPSAESLAPLRGRVAESAAFAYLPIALTSLAFAVHAVATGGGRAYTSVDASLVYGAALAVVVGDMGMSLGVTGNAMRLARISPDDE